MQSPRNLLPTDLVHDAYIEALVNARLAALRSLVEITSTSKDESEKRQAATTILKLPNPELPRRPLHTPIPIRYVDSPMIQRGPGGELPRQPTPFELAQAAADPALLEPISDPARAALALPAFPGAARASLAAHAPAAALAAAAGRADPRSGRSAPS